MWSELQQRRDLGEVGVADDDVQAAVLSASEWGSSRVLMIGRLSVVSRPTSTSKKSARCEIWKPGVEPSWPMPTRPAPVTICG